ncbi:HAD family hydrolase [Hyunsoonleella pacifica]|uniref:HAD family phosphatase n=1 Tax=Hyunsoonleella pacifica TaxID=1080224 RepID=A0A4Q9FSB9_9FLAO|nr:HAD family phosphatase [Hyunsoonleella pacifica]TBN18883.1 HAD family phosphatase [Hyunsoonleella pacifica]GGD05591.1 haloacid dehalogenase [Hyunsoonleella pacifica]
MIDSIIFDFGNVFINLDIEKGFKESLLQLGINELPKDIININNSYETGKISTEEFISFYTEKFSHLTENQLVDLWNIILKDFPKQRLEFLRALKAQNKYKLILLSNTNELHINWIKERVSFYEEFKNCFDAFYLSHEIHLRKPNTDIFEFVLNTHHLKPEKCLFIDDNVDNIFTAKSLNINTWHITPYKEDITELLSKQKHLL